MTDIAGERRKLAAVGLLLVRREAWVAAFDYSEPRAVDPVADALFLHIAVAVDPAIQTMASEIQVMRNIERVGIERFPSTGFSYNAACFDSGRLYEGQPITRRGAHTINDKQLLTCVAHGGSLQAPSWNLNVNARAIVLPQMVTDDVTDAQVDGIARWGAALILAGYVARGARWHGHRCVAAKDCPGGTGYARIPEIQRKTEYYVTNGLGEEMPLTENDLDAIQARAQLGARNGIRDYFTNPPAADLRDIGDHAPDGTVAKSPPLRLLAKAAEHAYATRGAVADVNTGIGGGIRALQAKTDALTAAVAALSAQVATLDIDLDDVDVSALAEQLAEAMPDELGEALVTALGRRLGQSGAGQ